jgi:hypothetical protein
MATDVVVVVWQVSVSIRIQCELKDTEALTVDDVHVLGVAACTADMRATAGGHVDVVLRKGDRVRGAGEDEAPVVLAYDRY